MFDECLGVADGFIARRGVRRRSMPLSFAWQLPIQADQLLGLAVLVEAFADRFLAPSPHGFGFFGVLQQPADSIDDCPGIRRIHEESAVRAGK